MNSSEIPHSIGTDFLKIAVMIAWYYTVTVKCRMFSAYCYPMGSTITGYMNINLLGKENTCKEHVDLKSNSY